MDRWIPCSERMPKEYNSQDHKESKDVLITLCCNSEKYKETETGFTRNGKWHVVKTTRSPVPLSGVLAVPTNGEWKVTAWMPLPKPYEEVDNETN